MPDIETHSTMPAPGRQPSALWDDIAQRLRSGEIVSIAATGKAPRHSAKINLRNRGLRARTSLRDGRLYMTLAD